MVLVAVASVPSAQPGPAPTAGTLLPPQKNFPGEVRGYQEPSGAKQTGQCKTTGKPSRARQTGQDSPQEQEALLGCFQKLRLPLGMTSQWPSQGPSATAFISATREAGGWNGLRGHKTRSHLPRVSMNKTDMIKMFLWAQHDLKTALLAVTGGLDPRG